MSYRLTHETPDALEAINQVLASSITAWQLSDRLYRLSVNAYRYRHSDWIDHQFYGLRDENNTLVAILVVNEDGSDLADDHRCLQIQGLFIRSEDQRRQLGSRLIHETVQVALNQSLEIVLVKAHESAVSFFEHHGFHRIPITDEVRDYPYRLVRSVI
ncbi:MAG: GNAT family N-acetyltransferase [Litorivicinaceae bacterium]|nr:GNAT family N-acetyltransferase [Litorivicinaceae bacterium]